MPLLGEFLGTLILIVLGTGVVANVLLHGSKGENAGWMTITTGWAIAVIVGVFVAQSVGSSQADINPAVSLVKLIIGHYDFVLFLKIVVVQILGAFCGAGLIWLTYHPHWRVTTCPDKKLAVFESTQNQICIDFLSKL